MKELRVQTSTSGWAIIVIDVGIVTDENLAILDNIDIYLYHGLFKHNNPQLLLPRNILC